MTVLAPPPSPGSPGVGAAAPERWRLRRTPGLDGLRAVGMGAVLLYHAEIAWAPGGFLGVSQFFTLSGFLITLLLLQDVEGGGGPDVRRFWARRARRLWPASLAALAGVAAYGATVADPVQAEALPKQVAAAAAQVANWLFIADDTSYVDQFAAPSPVLHFWSLSIEEQFYLLLPLGLAALLRVSRSRAALGAAVTGLIVACVAWTVHLSTSGSGIDRIYYGTDTRMPEILVGVLLAVAVTAIRPDPGSWRWRVLGWAGAAAGAVTIWMFAAVPLTETALWRGGIVGFSLVSCVVILGILSGAGPLRVLSWGPVAAVGRVTYGVYLYHFPIYLWLTSERTGLSQWPLFGLRLAVTLAVATLSYHLLEMPFRRPGGALSAGRVRFVVGPVVAVSLVVVTAATAGWGADDDPWATLASPGESATPPPPADAVLDVLVLTDAVGEPIADRLEEIDVDDETMEVVRAPLDCGDVIGEPPDPTCRGWSDTWPDLVQRHDPDVVFLYLDQGPGVDLARLSQATAVPPAEVAGQLIGSGLDLLTARGANVVWGTAPEGLVDGGSTATPPFHEAMGSLLQSRTDLRSTEYLPPVPPVPDEEYLTRATDTVLEGLRVHRRGPGGDVPRVMVVGDSQARSVGYGLERLEAETGGAVVWNLGSPGCGIVTGGTVRDVVTGSEQQPDPSCVQAVRAWATAVEQFRPDVVLVLSSLRDLQDRRLDGGGFRAVGDRDVDEHLVSTYVDAVDTLAAGGATVVWLKPPCLRYESPFGGGGRAPSAFEPERMEHLDEHVLPAVAAARPGHVVLYGLDDILCPGGEFLDDAGELRDIRPDGVHLSTEAARWLAEILHQDVVERYAG